MNYKKITDDPLFTRINLMLIAITLEIAIAIFCKGLLPFFPFPEISSPSQGLVLALLLLCGACYGLYLMVVALFRSDQSMMKAGLDPSTGMDFIGIIILLFLVLGLGFISASLTFLIRLVIPYKHYSP